MVEIKYIPATTLNNGLFNEIGIELELKGKKINIANIAGSTMISWFYGKDYENIRKQFNVNDDVMIIGDSGGFQIGSEKEKTGKEVRFNCFEILKWQEKNCNIGLVMDVPPSGNPGEDLFKLYSNQTKEYIERFVERRSTTSKLKLYNILHGTNPRHLDIWYKNVNGFNLDGWATGPKPSSDCFTQSQAILYLLEKGDVRHIHTLGVSGTSVIPILYYIAKKFEDKIDLITFDSSSYLVGSLYRRYMLQQNNGFYFFIPEVEGVYIGKPIKLNKLPCDCPICSNVTFKEMMEYKAGRLLSLHNLYDTLRYCNLLDSLKDEPEILKTFLKNKNRILKCFEYIDYCIKYNVNEGYKKYEKFFTNPNVVTPSTKSLFEY